MVLPYFKRAEDHERGADEFHGTRRAAAASPTTPCSSSRCAKRCIEAGGDAGIPANPDFNGASQEGVGYYQTDHQRAALERGAGLSRRRRQRKNLTIVTGAHARAC